MKLRAGWGSHEGTHKGCPCGGECQDGALFGVRPWAPTRGAPTVGNVRTAHYLGGDRGHPQGVPLRWGMSGRRTIWGPTVGTHKGCPYGGECQDGALFGVRPWAPTRGAPTVGRQGGKECQPGLAFTFFNRLESLKTPAFPDSGSFPRVHCRFGVGTVWRGISASYGWSRKPSLGESQCKGRAWPYGGVCQLGRVRGQAQGRHLRGFDGTGGTRSGWTRSNRHLLRISPPGR